jgi:predicted dehydrogenase
VNYTIIGGGFGIYGYLPVLITRAERLILPIKYRQIILSRKELFEFDTRISWVATLHDALCQSNAVVIATPPAVQVRYARLILRGYQRITTFILEKPLGNSPKVSNELLSELEAHSKSISVGYLFLYTPWVKRLSEAVRSNSSLSILWSFKAHHFRYAQRTWKTDHRLGGGPLRFYGIHLIALLSGLGYTMVDRSQLLGVPESGFKVWEATFLGQHLAQFNVRVDCCDELNVFRIYSDEGTFLELDGPFETFEISDTGIDKRTILINNLFSVKEKLSFESHKDIVLLWKNSEETTVEVLN